MKKEKLSDIRVVFLLAMLCCFLWGSATPAIKTGYRIFNITTGDTASIIVFAGVRFLLAGVLVILIQSLGAKKFVKPQEGSLKPIICLGLVQTILQYFCYYVGVAHTSGVTGTILSGTGGLILIIMSALIFKLEAMTSRKLAGVIMGFSGIILMNLSLKGGVSFHFALMGEGLILGSQIMYALSGIMVKNYSKKFSVVMLSGYQFIFGGLVMIITGLAFGGNVQFNVGFSGYLLLIYMAMISSVAYSVWGILMSHNPVSRVAIFNFMVPIFGVLLSAIFLNEMDQALQLNKLIALVLVCMGIYTVNKPKKAALK